jgi:ribonuclease BN (tRNA processing enzyme)
VESARDADLFVCEATLLRGELDGEPRGHLSLDEAVEAFEASNAKRLLVTHRPRELPTPDSFELAYDGLEIDV